MNRGGLAVDSHRFARKSVFWDFEDGNTLDNKDDGAI
jgi:hypothetical protein